MQRNILSSFLARSLGGGATTELGNGDVVINDSLTQYLLELSYSDVMLTLNHIISERFFVQQCCVVELLFPASLSFTREKDMVLSNGAIMSVRVTMDIAQISLEKDGDKRHAV